MIRISLTAGQLAGARFAVSPLLQVVTAILWLRSRTTEPDGWLSRRWRLVSPGSRSVFGHLIDPATSYVPDFLTPFPETDRPTVAQELQRVRDTPAGRLRDELCRFVRLGEVPPGYALARGIAADVADAKRGTPTAADRAAWDGDPHAVTGPAADALEEAWTVLLEPSWPLVRTVLETDVLHRVRQISSRGVQETVLDLVGGGHWDGATTDVTAPIVVDVSRRTGSVVLAPCVMLDDSPPLAVLAGPTPDDLYLGYPSRGRGALLGPFARAEPGQDPGPAGLGDVLGGTRLRLLNALEEPHTGAALAARLGVTAATVSYHLGRLHRGGLVHRQRVGKQVLYSLTDTARTLSAGRR